MTVSVTVHDETTSGTRTNTVTLDFLDACISVRDLLRKRVYEEVQDYNRATPEYFRGLVQPADAERVLNGDKLQKRRQIDWEEQYRRAIAAFERNGFFILVDDLQVESLDDEIELTVDTEISFVKLVPLVGG
jgi:hypothetical protein